MRRVIFSWALCSAVIPAIARGDEPAPANPSADVAAGREHVHIFMINGLTILPHIYGSMNPVGETLKNHGYVHNQTATHYWRWSFQDKIRQVYRCDPQARIVLVGYSIGAGVVHGMAHTLEKEGIPIALLVYLDGHTFIEDFHDRPANVERAVCIRSSSFILRGALIEESNYVEMIDGSRHLSVPKKEATLELLLRELDMVALGVPASAPPPPPGYPRKTPPTARPPIAVPLAITAPAQNGSTPAPVAQNPEPPQLPVPVPGAERP